MSRMKKNPLNDNPNRNQSRQEMTTNYWTRIMCLHVAMLLSLTQCLWAGQTNSFVSYEGKVTDESSQPVPGVKVTLIGTPLSTATDKDGAFKIAGESSVLATTPRNIALEFTGRNFEAHTVLPGEMRTNNLTVVLYPLPAKDSAVNLARFDVEVPPGSAPAKTTKPEIRQWQEPQTIDVEWGIADGSQAVPTSGRIEGTWCALGKIEPLEEGNGVTPTGEHHWQENRGSPTSGKRRGIRVTVSSCTGNKTISPTLSLWTVAGNSGFLVADLDRGPILIPSLGLYIVKHGGIPLSQFQHELAGKKLKTVAQQCNESPEESYASAMTREFGEFAKQLPAFPKPPYEPVMKIDVPEKPLVDQWRLGAWHLKRWCRKVNEDKYQVSIWRFRFAEMWEKPATARKDYETTFQKASPTCIAQESHEVIRALDILGLHDVAEGGLNHWLFANKFVTANSHGSKFADFNGILITDNPGAGGPGYDMKHPTGHGLIMEAAALHYRLTGNQTWLRKAAPRLQQACEWTLRQPKTWSPGIAKSAWCYGLQPPINFGDYGGTALFYLVNARYYSGVKTVADILSELNVAGAGDLVQEAESYRQNIRAATERSSAVTPVVRSSDGTFRRFVPATPYERRGCNVHDSLMGFACLADSGTGVYDSSESLVKDVVDLIEDTLAGSGGITGQIGYESHPRIHLLNDEIPLFLRSLYREYAALIRPWEWEADNRQCPVSQEALAGPAAYEFFEHPGKWAVDKTYEEAVFLQRVRNLLVMELGDALWLARATPRVWLEQGKKIGIKNAPTIYGAIAYEIVSDVDNGKINATVEMPSRKTPKEVVVRFRHPKTAPIKSVTVNGKDWKDFNQDKETITLKNLTGTVKVTAQY